MGPRDKALAGPLRKLCVAYKLKPEGQKKEFYKASLKAFSRDQVAWNSWRWTDTISAEN